MYWHFCPRAPTTCRRICNTPRGREACSLYLRFSTSPPRSCSDSFGAFIGLLSSRNNLHLFLSVLFFFLSFTVDFDAVAFDITVVSFESNPRGCHSLERCHFAMELFRPRALSFFLSAPFRRGIVCVSEKRSTALAAPAASF